MKKFKRYSLNNSFFGKLTYVKENSNGELCTLQELNDLKKKKDFVETQRNICIKHINKIDDVLEYSLNNCTKKRMKENVMNIIDEMTQELGELQKNDEHIDGSDSRFDIKEVK